MNNPRDVSRLRAVPAVVILLALHAPPFAEADFIMPQPEAPTTIFSARLGTADVDLSLLGSWTAALSFGFGILFPPGLPPKPLDSFPGVDQGLLFTQAPDLTASLTLLKKYFLDLSVLGNFKDNSIRLGYRGDADEALRSLVIGNKGVDISSSVFFQVPEQSTGSLGAMATLVSGTATNDLLLRWDASALKRKVFIGKSELVEQAVGIESYMRGRFFFLPDAALDPDTLQVFIEDPNGPYESSEPRRYRLAGFEDVALDSTLGLVSLRGPAKGRILVHYRKGGLEIGAASGATLPKDDAGIRDPTRSDPFSWASPATYLGLDMGRRRITIPSLAQDCLLLWEPGDNSPFEICNSYAFTSLPPSDPARIAFQLRKKNGNAVPSTGIIFQPLPEENRFVVIADRSLRSTFRNFYPFWDGSPQNRQRSALLYGPQRDSLAGAFDEEILAQFLSPAEDMMLEQDIVPGSVQLAVNGAAETRFEVEPTTGRVTLLVPILPTDRIEVTYRKSVPGTSGGDILLVWRDTMPLSDAAALSLAAGLRWNADPWSFTQEPYAKSGTIIASAGIEGKEKNFSYSAQVAASFTDPDTTGALRLFGMEGHSIQLDLSEDAAYPASAPDPSEPTGVLTQANRGYLYYGSTPYAAGGRMGPYTISGTANGSTSGKSLAFDFSLDSGGWVGAQVPISEGTDVDLSNARAVTMRFACPRITGGVDVYLQIGGISEDLDGSGTLKEEASPTSAGFPFVDQAHGYSLLVGAGPNLTGNGRRDSEDRNRNRILDTEDAGRIVTRGPLDDGRLSLGGGVSWTNVSFSLMDADRQRLSAARGVRLILKGRSGAPATGQVLIDSISFEGSPFWSITDPSSAVDRGRVEVREISEQYALHDPGSGNRFEDRFQKTFSRFHPGGERQEVLETLWTGLTTPSFSLKGFTAQGTGGIAYDTVVAHIRSPTTGVTYTFRLTDAEGRGIAWGPIPPSAAAGLGDGAWHEMKVSRRDGTVSLDGTVVSSVSPSFDPGAGSLIRLSVDLSGPASGALYVDEVYCTDPRGSFGAAFVGELSARFPGVVFSAGAMPIVSNIDIRQSVSLSSAGFASLYGIPSQAEDLASRSELSADLPFARISLDLRLREYAGSLSAAGGHRVTFLPSAPVSVMDAFALTAQGGFTREDSLDIRPAGLLSISLGSRSYAEADPDPGAVVLNQSWDARIGFTPPLPLTLSSALSLSQSLSGYPLDPGWYGERWAKEASLLLPWSGAEDLGRTEKFSLNLALQPSPVGLEISALSSLKGYDYSAAGWSQENDLDVSASVPFRIAIGGGEGISVRLGYRRHVSVLSAPGAGPRFVSETAEYGRIIALQGYLLTNKPLLEILADNSALVLPAWQTASQGYYSPSLSIAIERVFGSRLADLIVPSHAELVVGQETRKSADLSQASIFLQPKTVSRAVNLFGQWGALPLLPLVRTDEYSLTLSASVKGVPGRALSWREAAATAYALFQGFEDSQLTIVNTLRREERDVYSLSNPTQIPIEYAVSLGNDIQALLDWAQRPRGGVPLPFIPPAATEEGWIAHRESAELALRYQDSGAFHLLTATLGHATSLVFPRHGSVKASATLGFDAEALGGGYFAWRVALRAGVEAKLNF